MNDKFVICVNNDTNPTDLTLYKVYQVIPSEKADRHGLIRLVDDSGEDYFFPAPMFRPIELSAEVQELYAAFPDLSTPLSEKSGS